MVRKDKAVIALLAGATLVAAFVALDIWTADRLEGERERAAAGPYERAVDSAALACEGLPAPVLERIAAAPEVFFALLERIRTRDERLYLPVGKDFTLRGSAYDDLAPIPPEALAKGERGLKAREEPLDALNAMRAAALADGVDLRVTSSYRTLQESRDIYASFARSLGPEAAAKRVAPPGQSQHHLGTAFDFSPTIDGFKLTRQGRWLLRKAWTYGFSLSFPWGGEEITGYVFESWHYRYLGEDFCLLQKLYFGDMQYYALEFLSAW